LSKVAKKNLQNVETSAEILFFKKVFDRFLLKKKESKNAKKI